MSREGWLCKILNGSICFNLKNKSSDDWIGCARRFLNFEQRGNRQSHVITGWEIAKRALTVNKSIADTIKRPQRPLRKVIGRVKRSMATADANADLAAWPTWRVARRRPPSALSWYLIISRERDKEKGFCLACQFGRGFSFRTTFYSLLTRQIWRKIPVAL